MATCAWAPAAGDRAKVRYMASSLGSVGTRWFQAVITTVHSDGCCDVMYDDGDQEAHVLPKHMKASSAPLPEVRPESAEPSAEECRLSAQPDDALACMRVEPTCSTGSRRLEHQARSIQPTAKRQKAPPRPRAEKNRPRPALAASDSAVHGKAKGKAKGSGSGSNVSAAGSKASSSGSSEPAAGTSTAELAACPPPPADWAWPREGETIEVEVAVAEGVPPQWVKALVSTVLIDGQFAARIELPDGSDQWDDWFTWQEEGSDWRRHATAVLWTPMAPTAPMACTVLIEDLSNGSESYPLPLRVRRLEVRQTSSTQLNSTQVESIQLNSTQLESAQLDSTQVEQSQVKSSLESHTPPLYAPTTTTHPPTPPPPQLPNRSEAQGSNGDGGDGGDGGNGGDGLDACAARTAIGRFTYVTRNLNRTLMDTDGAMLDALLNRTAPGGLPPPVQIASHLRQCHGEQDYLFANRKQRALEAAARSNAERVEAERVEAERVNAERVNAERVNAERVNAEPVIACNEAGGGEAQSRPNLDPISAHEASAHAAGGGTRAVHPLSRDAGEEMAGVSEVAIVERPARETAKAGMEAAAGADEDVAGASEGSVEQQARGTVEATGEHAATTAESDQRKTPGEGEP